MPLRTSPRRWNPSIVSVASLLAMLAIVSTVGMLGTRYVIHYVQDGIRQHTAVHIEKALQDVAPTVERLFAQGAPVEQVEKAFPGLAGRIVGADNAVRLFLMNRVDQTILSDTKPELPRPDFTQFGTRGDTQAEADFRRAVVDWRALLAHETDPATSYLIRVRPLAIDAGTSHSWAIAGSSDLSTVTEVMADLHWRLDAVLLGAFGVVAVLGFTALRWLGRAYELRLERTLDERTRELNKAHQELLNKTRLATIGETASVLAHEMRNPLASIALALSRLSDISQLEDRDRRRLTLISGEVKRLEDLLSDTLDYVRPVALADEPQSLSDLLEEVLVLARQLAGDKSVTFEVVHEGPAQLLRLDPKQMKQVLWNLVKNATEASPPDSTITIRLACAGNLQILRMTNQGPQLDADTLRRAFDPFFSTKPNGSGLGLGLVKRVVEEHGGTVALRSTDQSEIEVELQLPIAVPA